MSDIMFQDADLIQISGGGPLGLRAYFGTDRMEDEDDAVTFEQRLKRCYELAGYAVCLGTAGESSRLVHGSWHGPQAPERIGHAWVELPRGLIWEPIYAAIFDGDALRAYARMWDERTYDRPTARKLALNRGDWGRWHESRYP